MSKTDQLIGTTVGDYQIQEVLGQGGMGIIYKATHILIGKKVAMKMLHDEYSETPEIVSRFFNEAKIVNQIGHQNIIDISDYGFTEDERPYFLMELLSGKTLFKAIRDAKTMDLKRAIHIILQVASALEASHKAEVIHRDLKPDNIFLIRMGSDPDFVKVLDFGIAKLAEGQNTKAGSIIGTPVYMAPEQIQGKGASVRSDLYSLGIIFYELLTGEVPYQDNSYHVLYTKIVTEPIVPPRQKNTALPQEAEDFILKAVHKDPTKRFQNAAEFLEALSRLELLVAKKRESAAGVESQRPTMIVDPLPIAAPSSSKGLLFGGVGVVLFSAAVVLFIFMNPEKMPQNLPSVTPATTLNAPSSQRDTVSIELTSTPPGAVLKLDDQILGKTPYLWHPKRAEEPLTVGFSLEGYGPQTKTFVPNADRSFDLTLAPTVAPQTILIKERPDKEKPDKEKPDKEKPKPIDNVTLPPDF